jgi:choice-of-anchor A domain-containing protein
LTFNRVIFNFPGTGGMLNKFKNDTAFRGTLLAPQRDIVIDNPPVFGSVIGSTINIHSGASIAGCDCP